MRYGTVLLALLFSLNPAWTDNTCKQPASLHNTKEPEKRSFSAGEKFRYSCSIGHVRKAGTSNLIKCGKNGSWTQSNLICIVDLKLQTTTSTPLTTRAEKGSVANTTSKAKERETSTEMTVFTEHSTWRASTSPTTPSLEATKHKTPNPTTDTVTTTDWTKNERTATANTPKFTSPMEPQAETPLNKEYSQTFRATVTDPVQEATTFDASTAKAITEEKEKSNSTQAHIETSTFRNTDQSITEKETHLSKITSSYMSSSESTNTSQDTFSANPNRGVNIAVGIGFFITVLAVVVFYYFWRRRKNGRNPVSYPNELELLNKDECPPTAPLSLIDANEGN
ncbi:interleukin-15 receptor subunit alpha isoform X1 [Polypterus senegalus]|uniref:interleukin-15 receptor subunit alpha isoform X1 n=1 Tax=Polypterus senegalus TaxID=55291 RepID=UPI00196549E7|nr:interleukin-15 receptor subunit alpha isoform X1 [Polypterus senegalus]